MKKLFFVLIILLSIFDLKGQISDDKKDEFNKYIREADGLFSQNKYVEAKEFYEKALSLNPTDKYAINQRDKSIANSKNKTGEEEGKNYQKIINKADEKFNLNDLENAKSLYQRALGLKPNDAYPKRKIEEIDAKLNPKPVEKSAPLPDLGVSSNLSINDAEKILAEAEAKRQTRKNNSIDSNSFKSSYKEEDLAFNREKEINASKNDIKSAMDKVDAITSNSKIQQDSLKDQIQKKSVKMNNINDEYSTLQNEKGIRTSISLTEKYKNLDSISSIQKPVGAEMDVYLAIKTTRFNDSIEIAEKKIKDELNYKIDDINHLNLKEEKKISDNQLSKFELINKFDSTFLELDKSNISQNTTNDQKHYNINKGMEMKELKQDSSSQFKFNKNITNKVSFNPIATKINLSEDSISKMTNKNVEINTERIKKVDGKLIDSLSTSNDTKQKEQSNQLLALNQVISNDNDENELIKNKTNQDTQSNINKVDIDNAEFENKGKENQNTSIDKLKNIDRKNYDANIDANKKDYQNEFSTIDQLNTNMSKINTAYVSTNKTSDANVISNESNNLSENYDSEEKKQFDKSQDIRDLFENIDNKTFKLDDKAANSLGASYPEGVTEESFNKNDDRGLAYAVITRRIVVKNGFGAVFVRTVTKNSITYTKDNQPITEHVWQIETQNANMKKN
jgi:hypothetical protein